MGNFDLVPPELLYPYPRFYKRDVARKYLKWPRVGREDADGVPFGSIVILDVGTREPRIIGRGIGRGKSRTDYRAQDADRREKRSCVGPSLWRGGGTCLWMKPRNFAGRLFVLYCPLMRKRVISLRVQKSLKKYYGLSDALFAVKFAEWHLTLCNCCRIFLRALRRFNSSISPAARARM